MEGWTDNLEDDVLDSWDFTPDVPAIEIPVPDKLLIKKNIENSLSFVQYYEKKPREYNGKLYEPYKTLWVHDLLFCPKKTVFEFFSGKPPSDIKSIIKQNLGNLLHRKIVDKLKVVGESEVLFQKEYSSSYNGEQVDYLLVGRVDFLMENAVLEFKTTYNSFINLEKPPTYYTDQTQLYMWLTDKHLAILAVILPADGEVLTFKIERDDERIKYLLNKGIEIVYGCKYTNHEKLSIDNNYKFICNACIVEDCNYNPKHKT